MKVSLNWLAEFVDLSGIGGAGKLAEMLTSRGLEVEEIHSEGQAFDQVVTAQILEKKPHPGSDRLSLCQVTIGSGEPLDIVCGAQNMKAGDKVALAMIGAHLPNGLTIAQGKIRGEVSNGMLCSETELKLKDTSDGIMILPAATPLGKPLADILGRNDTIFTLKLTANRGDCLSHFGLAREIAAGIGQRAKKPAAKPVEFKGSPISISLEAGDSAPQFYGISIEGVNVAPSPDWLVRRLEGLGSRSINNVVDATNLVMLELGHPTHAYDADRLEGSRICVRVAREGEKLPLLDRSEITLTGTELVIADDNRPVGLAGVMGGGNSEVALSTTRVFLECAEFAPSLVRRAKARHQKQTEAAHRFERGVDPTALGFVISRLAGLVLELAGGKIIGGVEAHTKPLPPLKEISLDPVFFNAFLGMELQYAEIEKILKNLECTVIRLVEKGAEIWSVTPPSYRLDLLNKEDLSEEVARTVGYDKIPATIPVLTSSPIAVGSDLALSRAVLIDRAKDAMAAAGLNETLNFAFTSQAWLAEFGLTSSAKVLNPLSEEHEFLVPSLVPGIVKNALDNWRHHFGSESLAIRLFELRPTFFTETGVPTAQGEMETGVQEKWKLAFAISGPRLAGGLRQEQSEVDFYDLKALVEGFFEVMGTKGIRMLPGALSRTPEHPLLKLLHPHQSVEILAGNQIAGYFGMFHPAKAKGLKARAPLWICELDWDVVARMSRSASGSRVFKSWPAFPPMERDFALVLKSDIAAEKIAQVILKAGKPLAKVAKIFDIYRGSQVPEGMTSVAVRVIFFDEGRSLQEVETDAASTQIVSALQKELGAQLRS